MLKWKYKKIFASFLAVALLLQMVPESVLAEELTEVESASVMSQLEQGSSSEAMGISENEENQQSEQAAFSAESSIETTPSPTESSAVPSSEISSVPTESSDVPSSEISSIPTESSTVSSSEPSSVPTEPSDVAEVESSSASVKSDDESKSDDASDESNLDDSEEEATEEETTEEETTEEVDLLAESEEITLTTTKDFIELSNKSAAEYYNKTITITRNDMEPFDLTGQVDGKSFRGFGDENYPFQGTITITSSQSSNIDIKINHSFFNYLDQSVKINGVLYLKAKGNVNAPLLANYLVNKSASEESTTETKNPSTISFTIDAESDEDIAPSFSGIIGTMDSNTNLILSVTDKMTNTGLSITGTDNLGFFCNTMNPNAHLTIGEYLNSSSSEIEYSISTLNGHAGGLVGEMKDGASLTISKSLSLTGNVNATKAAGGLVGQVDNADIELSEEITRGGTVTGASESGGYIGKAIYRTEKNLDLSKLKFSNLTLTGEKHVGGFFGVLNYECSDGKALTIKNIVENAAVTHTGNSWQFGGVIGQYSTSSQSDTLRLESHTMTICERGSSTAVGGVIGSIAGTNADSASQSAVPAYVEIANATIAAQIQSDLNAEGSFGGLVGEMANIGGQGHFLSASGVIKVSSTEENAPSIPKIGGLLGQAKGGILRISGTTDLSKFQIVRTGTASGQIVGEIDGTIVYAMGSGNGNGGEGYNWKFIRPSARSVSDIGSYGEVIRLNDDDLDENKLFVIDSTSHGFRVNASSENLTVSSRRDLAALAILIQQQGSNSALLGKNITISSETTAFDLSGTGIYSLLRDNGSQTYKGTFDGNTCTIKVAAGEPYGYMSDGTLVQNSDGNSGTVGIGQLYNHSTIGFLPCCSNGTVKNLTLDGSIYFHNVANGVDVRCGAVTGYAENTSFENVIVKTSIVYRDGLGGDGLKMISIGGFIGRAIGNVVFNTCSMQGTIFSASGCHDFAIGGYLAMGEETDTTGVTVTFKNCDISKAKIEHAKFVGDSSAPDAFFGGLIGRMVGSVTVAGLTIDALTMKSYATGTSGGLFGYCWFKKNTDNNSTTTDSVTITGVTIKNSKLEVQGTFGGLIYRTDEYWKIGDGTAAGQNNVQEAPKGIRFESGNTFSGKTSENAPSALLICSTIRTDDEKGNKDKAYIEILVDGLCINKDEVSVILTGGDYFDDIVGKTKYGEDGYNAVVSIGLTEQSADEVTLIDQSSPGNTWKNQCTVNGKETYTNKNTRYYYNVDYYRKQVENQDVTDIDTPGKLLLRSLYVYSHQNLKQYFVKGSDTLKLTGKIDLTGVSYYPVARVLTIDDATVTFDYTNMNANAGKKYSEINLQHYQMQTGLFSAVSQKFTVTKLTLCGTFGKYEENKAGVLICDNIYALVDENQAGITIDNLVLDGIQCENGTKLPLLVNSVGSNTAISMNDVTYVREKYTNQTAVASALMGQIGDQDAQKISLEFSNMDLNRKNENWFFKTAIFATAFRYKDGASGGAYNFETTTQKVTFGKEISNGVSEKISHNRNSYDAKDVTGQVWYFDTFGSTEAGSYVGADGKANLPQDFSSYLPYIGHYEDKENNYYEIDVNQKAVYLVDGCGTYGHPWVIKDVYQDAAEDTSSAQRLFTGEDQMMTVMRLLKDTARNGVVLKINKEVLKTKLLGQGEITAHTGADTNDVIVIKNGKTWTQAEKVGNRYQEMTGNNVYTVPNELMMAYLRNGYFLIAQDLKLNIGQFSGFGSGDVSRAFSGVIVGKKENNEKPTITLTGEDKVGTVGGLICYSQGSVVKNLKIVFDVATFSGDTNVNFFGGVIGSVIGGDNIIDNVDVTFNVNLTDSNGLAAVGGYVGLVGGIDGKKGGGVVFRNISASSLRLGTNNSDLSKEVSAGNNKYYWNPYVGRVLDGYACAEESTCSTMGDNTDKNYKIPKLNSTDKLKIEGNNSVQSNESTTYIYPEANIILDSNQSIWLLSAIVNSGFGAKIVTANYRFEYYKDNNLDETKIVDASYYGRTRRGSYDNVGTATYDDNAQVDDNDFWGGRITNNNKELDHRKHSASYLSQYVVNADQNISIDTKALTYSLTEDDNGRSITFAANQTYDLRSYGNGFRGIGNNYGSSGQTTDISNDAIKSRALKLKNSDNKTAVEGNGATIKYCRTIYEISTDTIYVRQAGFLTQCFAGSSNAYTVQNLNFEGVTLKRNNTGNFVAFGVVFARDGAYSPSNLKFENVTVKNATLEQADWSAALLGYMSRSNQISGKKQSISFENCEVQDFTAGIQTSSDSYKMNHCGGLVGKIEWPSGKDMSREVEFKDCKANKINLYNVQNGGLLGGHIFVPCTITSSNANTGNITPRTDGGGGMGGLIGKIEKSLTVQDSNVANVCINGTYITKNSPSYFGGIVGDAMSSVAIQNVTVKDSKLVGQNLGGIIGYAESSVTVENVEVSNSDLAGCKDKKHNEPLSVGGLIGLIGIQNGSLKGFNIISNNNLVGCLINNGSIQSKFDSNNFSNLSANNIYLKLSDDKFYSYEALAKGKRENIVFNDSSPCGIWVGNANGKDVNLVSVSCQGEYSAGKNIGSGETANSYVIYADYTGAATQIQVKKEDGTTSIVSDASKVNSMPDAVLTVGSNDSKLPLTGDGAAMVNKVAVRDTIINETLASSSSLLKGYHGGDATCSLDNIMSQFGTKGVYQSRLSNYKKEEENSTSGSDFPILILNATTKNELNSIVNSYISVLTNTDQTQTTYYNTITPTTYKYDTDSNVWTAVSSEEQTMAWTSGDGIKINRGKYDNNKQQITILDVVYQNPIENATNVYHLYIPVLVKKLMDVTCSVKIINGAVGYDPGNIGTNATLNSFGENYTVQVSYRYQWMVSEWQSMLENGDSLLWNFDKTVSLGELEKLDQEKIHLTVVNLNTHESQSSYMKSKLKELQDANIVSKSKETLNLEELAKKGNASYLCDLLPLKAEVSTTGTYKKVEIQEGDDTSVENSNAVLRIWNESEKKFIYYALKAEDDPQGTEYYTVTLDTKCAANEILPVTEQYYLVMNCTEGNTNAQMINTKVELNKSYSKQQIPTRITGTTEQVYIVGDFYKISNASLQSQSTTGSTEMISGSNDTIKVKISSDVTAAANEAEFGQYVNKRSIYYQYFVQLVDQEGKAVDMKGAASILSLKMQKKDGNGSVTETTLNPVTDLDSENGFITQFGENGCFITVKALGEQYTGSTITAEIEFSYSTADLNEQFPLCANAGGSTGVGVQFKMSAVMAYQQDSLGSSSITASTGNENKLYFRVEEAQAKLSYDSYNVTTATGDQNWDGNTSQLGINGRENNDASMQIKSRALLDAADVSGLNLTNESSDQYPCYLEGELTLAKKTETPVNNASVVGKTYEDVSIGSYLSDFEIQSGKAEVDMTSNGLGLQENGKKFKFKIKLKQDQVANIINTPLLININYNVKTGQALVDAGGQYANYKVTVSVMLKNSDGKNLLTGNVSDYLIYTNAKVYLGIIGVTD